MTITTLFDGFAIIEDPEYKRITIKETVLANNKVRDFKAKREFDKKVFKMRDRFLIGSDVIKFNDNYDALLDKTASMWAIICDGYKIHFFKSRNYIDIRFDEIFDEIEE